jgi:chorismate synthase
LFLIFHGPNGFLKAGSIAAPAWQSVELAGFHLRRLTQTSAFETSPMDKKNRHRKEENGGGMEGRISIGESANILITICPGDGYKKKRRFQNAGF